MENDFRLVLIGLSGLVIGGIFLHGLWTIRKNKKNPYKLKTERNEKIEPIKLDFDGSGFDQYGVSKAKVVNKVEPTVDPIIDNKPMEAVATTQPEASVEQPLDLSFDNKIKVEPTPEQVVLDVGDSVFDQPHVESVEQKIEKSTAPELVPEALKIQEPLVKNEKKEPTISFKEPVTQPKQSLKNPDGSIKKNQMEIQFEAPVVNNKYHVKPVKEKKVVSEPLMPEVLALSVVVGEGKTISGAALLPALLTLGMRFGDMDIFHRHQDNAGNGEITFSCANMLKPGVFDIDNMESFTTQGITFFMQLPNASDPLAVFNQMLSAAKQLVLEFNGQLLDGQRSVMTKQTEQHYLGQIREFDRKSRIASF